MQCLGPYIFIIHSTESFITMGLLAVKPPAPLLFQLNGKLYKFVIHYVSKLVTGKMLF